MKPNEFYFGFRLDAESLDWLTIQAHIEERTRADILRRLIRNAARSRNRTKNPPSEEIELREARNEATAYA